MKEKVTFSIDKNTMDMVRDNIPNMSQFVEDCFNAYLTFAIEDEEERGEELRQAWADFHKAKLNIHLLMKVDYEGRDIERAIERQKTDAWLYVWADYRRVGSTQQDKIEKSAKALDLEVEVLKQLLYNTLAKAKSDMTKLYVFDNWKYIEENILPNVEVEDEEEDVWDEILNG
jgi:hypothetical protein